MALLIFIFFLGFINLSKCDYGVILQFEPESLSTLVDTNITFKAKLIKENYTEKEDKQFQVTLKPNIEEIILNPFELNFTFKSNSTSTDEQIDLIGYKCGYAEILATNTSQIDNIKTAFIRITIYRYDIIKWVTIIVGWIYFIAWSVSFYPQTYSNYKRKSVVGFNLDYVALNFVGHTCYCTFNIGLKYIPFFRDQYFSKNEHGVNPVQLNDVLFSSHAVFATIIHIVQCVKYDRGNQKVSLTCKVLLAVFFIIIMIGSILAVAEVSDYLELLYLFSYIKLAITFLKYCPQAFQNWKNQSTKGWSIGYVILDLIGGLNSIFQMLLIAFNYDDWGSFIGDLGKLGLGAVSVLFDFLFLFQHYVLYNNKKVKSKSQISQVGLVLDDTLTHL